MKNKKIIIWIANCIFCLAFLFGITGIQTTRAEKAVARAVEPKSLWTEMGSDFATIEQNAPSPDFVQIGWGDRYHEYTTENLCPVPEYIKTGVKVTVPTGNVVLKYNNIIDLNALDQSIPLLDWMPLAESRGTPSILRFTVRLEDIADESNYVEIYFYQYFERLRWGLDFSERETKVEKQWLDGSMANYMVYHFNPSEAIISPFSLRYEKSTDTYCLYAYRNGTEYITESMSPTSVELYDRKTFKGFSSGLVSMSVTANAIAGTSSYYLYNVAGQGLNGEVITDMTAPSLLVDKSTETAKAYIGKNYKLFDAKALDVIDGEIPYQIRLFEPNAYKSNYTKNDYTVITGDSFIPSKAGNYTVLYYVEDSSGNATEKPINISSAYEWPALDILVEPFSGTLNGTDNDFELGKDIAVPKFSVTGGSGSYTTSVKAYSLLDNEELTIDKGYVSIKKAGNYKFAITAVDYCGNRVVKSVYFDIQSSKFPMINGTLNMYKAFYDYQPVELPVISAYDYNTYPGIAVSADFKIVAVGENGHSKELYNSSSNSGENAFLPDKDLFGDTVTIKYIYKCRNCSYDVLSDCLVKEYQIPIYDTPKYLTDYFYAPSGMEVSGNTAIEYKNTQRYVSVCSTDGEASTFSFVNPIAAENAYIEMTFPAQGQNFSGFTVRFMDAYNADIGFEVTIYKIAGTYTNKSLLRYNGREYMLLGGFDLESGDYGSVTKSPIAIYYKDGKLYDYSGLAVCEVDADFLGDSFDGFPSGAVRLEFVFNKVQAGAQVNISKIADQNMYLRYSGQNLAEFTDQIKPLINVKTEDKEYNFGDTVQIPSAKAVDTITSGCISENGTACIIRVMVEVRTPSNKTILKKRELVDGLSFVLDSYGDYRIIYTATDNNNLTKTETVTITAKDKSAPMIILNDTSSVLHEKVNQELKLPTVVVLDNVTSYVDIRLSCMVIAPNGSIVNLVAEVNDQYSKIFTYTPEAAGQYTIIYLAIDHAENRTMKVLTLLVDEV